MGEYSNLQLQRKNSSNTTLTPNMIPYLPRYTYKPHYYSCSQKQPKQTILLVPTQNTTLIPSSIQPMQTDLSILIQAQNINPHTWNHSHPQGSQSWRWWRRCAPRQSQSLVPAVPLGQVAAMMSHPPAWSPSHQWSAWAPPWRSDGSTPGCGERKGRWEVWNGRSGFALRLLISHLNELKYKML